MEYALLIGSVLIGGGLSSWIISKGKLLKYILAFSASFLLSIIFVHLMPELFNAANAITYGYFVLAGFLFQVFVELLTHGIEHGHVHKTRNIGLALACLGLGLHAFVEGMPLVHHDHDHDHSGLLFAILFHKIPVAIVFMSFLSQIKLSGLVRWAIFGTFAILTPLGMLVSTKVASLAENAEYLMAISIGIFLHVSTTIIFEASEGHQFRAWKFLAIVIGAAIAIL